MSPSSSHSIDYLVHDNRVGPPGTDALSDRRVVETVVVSVGSYPLLHGRNIAPGLSHSLPGPSASTSPPTHLG